jgi:hypothetical protein
MRHSKIGPPMTQWVKSGKAQNEQMLSALSPKADKQQTFRYVRLVPAADICSAAKTAPLFDHLVSDGEQLVWNYNPDSPGSREIDDQLELYRLLDWKVGRLLAFEDAAGIDAGLLK